MPPPTLFIGVVSYGGSRFALSQGPAGLAAQLAARMPGAIVEVLAADLLPADSSLVTPEGVQASLTAERHLEADWASFLGRPRTPRWWAIRASRVARRSWQRLRPPSPSMVRRLLNIELAHLHLMRQGLAVEADWVLVLEDDAHAPDLDDLVGGLEGLLVAEPAPAYINLSASFTPHELGIEHLLSAAPGHGWAGPTSRTVLTASRPVTNTVCAIAYHRGFLTRLVPAMQALPVEPVVPIDWKLNQALMDLYDSGGIQPGDCWLVEPAPIAQMSMRPAGILPS